MTKLTTGLAQELYDQFYIGESRPPKWVAMRAQCAPLTLIGCWQSLNLRLRNRSEAMTAKHREGLPWIWDAAEKMGLSTNGHTAEAAKEPDVVQEAVRPTHTITLPADGLPVRLLLVVGNVRLEIQVGK